MIGRIVDQANTRLGQIVNGLFSQGRKDALALIGGMGGRIDGACG